MVTSREAFLSIEDRFPFGILYLDNDLVITGMNAFLRERLPPGISGEEKIPLVRIIREQNEQSLLAFRQVLDTGQPLTLSSKFHRSVFRLTPPPGSPFKDEIPQSVTIIPIQRYETVRELVVLVQDVSDRVLAETELKEQIEKLTILHELDLSLSTLEWDDCVQNLVTRLRGLFRADFAALLVVRQGDIHLVAWDGLPVPDRPLSSELMSGLTGWVVKHMQPVNIDDVRKESRYFALFDSIRSELIVPLLVNGQCIGVIALESSNVGAFSESDQKLLEMVAFSAAAALHNAQVHAEVNYWRTYYEGVVNQTDDIIYTVDRDLNLTGVNAAWDAFAQENDGLSWHSSLCIGKNLLSGLKGEQRTRWENLCKELLNGEREDYREDIACHAPDRERWLTLRAVPLKDENGQIDGIIFTTHDISEHVFAERRMRVVNSHLETLVRLSQLLNTNLSNQTVPQVAVQTLADLFQVQCVTITRFDEQRQAYRVYAAHGASQRHIGEFFSSKHQAAQIIRQYGRTGIIYDLGKVQTDNAPIYQADNLHGLLYSLIEYQGKIVGSLNIYTCDPQRRFTQDEVELVQSLTPQIGLALENARLYNELINLATTDSLTGIANRRQLDDLLALEVERSKRYQHPFCVLMLDLDHFKCYNDTFGHDLGDQLLVSIAAMLRRNSRAGDIPARYGGDEFVVILPETSIDGALVIARRLQTAVAEIPIPHTDDQPCEKPAMSIGLSAYPAHSDTPAGLLHCADQALYRAKQEGRNRVVVFSSV